MSQLTITPKLVVSDADAAIRFYASALGARVLQRYEADGRVVFALLGVGDQLLQLKDGDDVDPAPAPGVSCPVILDVLADS